jgi:hypothetical protein
MGNVLRTMGLPYSGGDNAQEDRTHHRRYAAAAKESGEFDAIKGASL